MVDIDVEGLLAIERGLLAPTASHQLAGMRARSKQVEVIGGAHRSCSLFSSSLDSFSGPSPSDDALDVDSISSVYMISAIPRGIVDALVLLSREP